MAKPKTKPTPADELLRQYRQGLEDKVKTGKRLTKMELAQLQTEAEGGPLGSPVHAKSKVELATVLEISRPTLDRWLKKPGCPKAETNGSYFVPAFRAFIKPTQGKPGAGAQTGEDGELELAQPGSLREKILCEKAAVALEDAKFDLEVKRKIWIKRSEVADAIRRCNEKVTSDLRRRFVHVVPALYKACGGDPIKCAEINAQQLEEALELIHSDKW